MNRSNRSQKYQYLILELPCEDKVMSAFPDYSNINYDRIGCLRDQLLDEVKRIMDLKLTPNQSYILKMYYFENMTQSEIAHKIGKNQISVLKSMCGNPTYVYCGNGKNKKIVYGGSIKKLQKYCLQDPVILNLLSEIQDLQ
jgi:hypothetical protein